MEELWKDIQGYEGLYQVSNLGRVKSLSRLTIGKKYGKHNLKEKLLKPTLTGKYYTVALYKNGKSTRFYVHRLVGVAFIENFNNYTDINHKDGNTLNNIVDNIEWCTRSYNIYHSYNTLNRKVNLQNFEAYRNSRKRKINQYDLNGTFIKEWQCISDAEKALNVKSFGKICACCQHQYGRKSAFGYKWEYAK